MRKRISLAMAAVMAVSMGTAGSVTALADDVTITIFNSKTEIQSQLEEMAEEYSDKTGVTPEIYYSNDTVLAHLSPRYAANEPYTMAMVGENDLHSLLDYTVDLSDQEWVKDTDYAATVDGAVYAFPLCIEARGLIYNADAIEAITGETFNPDDYKTLDAFKGLLDTLVEGGMEAPTGIMKEDWSLGAHYLAEVYETHDDVDAFISSLQDGSAKLIDDEKFNSLMDTFDVLMQYNYAADSAVSAEREVTEQMLAEGDIAFMFGGNWDWAVLSEYDCSENMSIMPLPQNTDDGTNEKLVGGASKYFYIDSSDNTTDEERQAAKDFLNWLVYDEEGQDFLVNDCALIPAFSNVTLDVKDPLGASVKKYMDEGRMISDYKWFEDEHYTICGASFQKYLAGAIDREGFAEEIENYWKTAEVVAH